jgi:putative restriction endonuclease
MAKALLTTKVDPTYDDLPEERYHFPRTYLRQIEAARGDFIVYDEPRRASGDLSSTGGRQAYFATARVANIVPDRTRADLFYALIDSYLEFARPVPFREGLSYYESALQRDDGATSKGAFGRAVRALPDAEYREHSSGGLREHPQRRAADNVD